MRRNFLVALFVGTGLCFTMWCTASAQNTSQPGRASSSASSAGVALVDVAQVFKKYDKFNNLHNQLKEEVKAREAEIAKLQTELKTLLNQRTQLNPESQTYKDLESRVVQKKAELELLNESSRREFTQKEAGIYHQTYQEVEDKIKRYAEAKGIILVLRAAKDEDVSSANPQEVIKEMSQQVIYALPGLDITDTIIEMLNGRPVNAGGPTTVPKSQTPPPGKTGANALPKTGQNDKNDLKKPTGGTIKK